MPWLPPDPDRVIIVDLPGAEAVAVGAALALRGWRPVPVFNGCDGPSPLVEVAWAGWALPAAGARIAAARIPDDAPPAFLLDARRLGRGTWTAPGRFDNRWQVLPQDLPSGNRLAAAGHRRAMLVAGGAVLQDDLAHVLHRWQEAGVSLEAVTGEGGVEPLRVARPRGFGAIGYWLGVVMGLRRNASGGFGGVIPQPSSGHG